MESLNLVTKLATIEAFGVVAVLLLLFVGTLAFIWSESPVFDPIRILLAIAIGIASLLSKQGAMGVIVGLGALAYAGERGWRLYHRIESRVFAERLLELKEMGIEIQCDSDAESTPPDNQTQTAPKDGRTHTDPSASRPGAAPPLDPRFPDLWQVELVNGEGVCADLDLEFERSMTGAPIVHSTREDEVVRQTLNATRVLMTSAQIPFADGEGVLVITDHRLIGLISGSRKRGMPAHLNDEGTGSVIVFDVDRDELADLDLTPARFGKHLHMATLYGNVTVRVTPTHVLDPERARWRFPELGEIEEALSEFVAGESTRVAPERDEQEAPRKALMSAADGQETGELAATGEESKRKSGRLQRAMDAALDALDELT